MRMVLSSFKEALRWRCEIFHNLKSLLEDEGFSSAVGDEGGFAPQISNLDQAISLICKSIEKSNKYVGQEVFIAIDAAASELYNDGYINTQK